MAEPRQARVMARMQDGGPGQINVLELLDNPDLRVKGGQYAIVNTGRNNNDGKLIKRAYSIFGIRDQGRQFLLAAEPVAGGIASSYLNELIEGDRITFSGPWGRFYWPDDALEPELVAAAFGSGITAVLGYLNSVPQEVPVHLYWFTGEGGTWLGRNAVQECAARPGLNFEVHDLGKGATVMHEVLTPAICSQARFIAAGEGSGVDLWLTALRERTVPDTRLQNDIFYRVNAG